MRGYQHPQRQHWALLDACRQRDVPRAKEIIKEHFGDTARMLVAALSNERMAAGVNSTDSEQTTFERGV
jgi:DNA-binding GntR family transcriptional regulator